MVKKMGPRGEWPPAIPQYWHNVNILGPSGNLIDYRYEPGKILVCQYCHAQSGALLHEGMVGNWLDNHVEPETGKNCRSQLKLKRKQE